MGQTLADLGHNLVAGARLALGLRVRLSEFRITLAALLALIAFSFAVTIALDGLRIGIDGRFSIRPLQGEGLHFTIFLLAAAMFALALRQLHLLLALPVLIFAAGPLVEVAEFAYRVAVEDARRYGTAFAIGAWLALTAWVLFIFARAILLALAPRPQRPWLAIAAGTLLFLATGMGAQMLFPESDWFYAARDGDRPWFDLQAVVSEQALARQPELLAEVLQALEAQRPGVADVYFVGFAPYAMQDVFRKDVRMARAVAEERLDAAGRSVVLLNHPQTVLETPLATLTHLRAALAAIGKRIDRDEDLVLVFLTSHGGKDHRLSVEFPPLRLDAVTPQNLRAALDEAGIRWRIVVVSACYSGGFVSALADEHTLVLTAAASDRTSFGCGDDSELTFFADALFNQALRRERSLPRAFEEASRLVAERERAEGLEPPSNPQMSLGSALRDRLPALERSLGTRPARTAACSAGSC